MVRLSHPLHVHGEGPQEDQGDFRSILFNFLSANIGALQTIQQRFQSEATITVCHRFTFSVLGMEAFKKFSGTSRCGIQHVYTTIPCLTPMMEAFNHSSENDFFDLQGIFDATISGAIIWDSKRF